MCTYSVNICDFCAGVWCWSRERLRFNPLVSPSVLPLVDFFETWWRSPVYIFGVPSVPALGSRQAILPLLLFLVWGTLSLLACLFCLV